MGWYGNNIGGYTLTMHDAVFEHVKKGQPKEYYENYGVSLYFKDGDGKETELGYPLSLFIKIVKRTKHHSFEPLWDKGMGVILGEILFDILKAKKVSMLGTVELLIYRPDNVLKYFLISQIGATDIELNNTGGVIHTINSYDDIRWLHANGMEFRMLLVS